MLSFVIFSDTEGANIIVTAGHGGLKFWDMRLDESSFLASTCFSSLLELIFSLPLVQKQQSHLKS